MFKLKQSWWHIENKIQPSHSLIFREVTDFYTDKQFVSYQIPDYFVKLKIKSRYKPQELNFLDTGGDIRINLGDLKQNWPKTDDCPDHVRHIKLEIEYINIKPKFKKITRFHLPYGYKSTFEIDGLTYAEFSITVPPGMKICTGDKVKLLLKLKDGKKIRLYHEDINVTHTDGKNTYNILIDEKSYQKIKNTPSNDIETIKVNYEVINQKRFLLFPVFPILILIFGSIACFNYPDAYLDHNVITISLTYVIIFVAFFSFYMTFRYKDGYEIPFNRFVIGMTALSALILIIPKILPSLLNFWPWLCSMILSIVLPFSGILLILLNLL